MLSWELIIHIVADIIPLSHVSLPIRAVFTGRQIELYHYFTGIRSFFLPNVCKSG